MHSIRYIAITFDDGSVGIMQFVEDPNLPPGTEIPGYDPKTGWREATDEAVEYEIARSAWAPRTPVRWDRITALDIPTDREYRNAWRMGSKGLGHDMKKVRAMALGRVREARAAEFARLDGEWMRATGKGDTAGAARIEAERQALRDLPAVMEPRLKACKTVDDVKALGTDPLTLSRSNSR